MTVEVFESLESQIPAMEAQQAMRLAMIAAYPHASKDGAANLWRHWVEQAHGPRPIDLPPKGALLSFNGVPVDFATLRAELGAALGRGLVA